MAASNESFGSTGISKSKSGDTVYVIREPKNPSPTWQNRRRSAFPSPLKFRHPRKDPGNRTKQIWDSLGVVLLVLQLSAHVLSQLRGAERSSHARVEGSTSNGSCLPTSSGYYSGNSNSSSRSYASADATSYTSNVGFGGYDAFSIHFIVDIYFFIDLVVRYRWSYYTHKFKIVGKNHHHNHNGFAQVSMWFVIDILLIFPHGFCWKLFEARPALQLLTIKEGRKRPILDFFFHRNFRLNVLKLVREHRAERKVLRTLFPWLLPPPEGVRKVVSGPRWLSLLGALGGKTARVFGWGFRLWRRVKKFSFWTTIIQIVSWLAMSVRAFSRLSPADFEVEKSRKKGTEDDSDVD